MRVRGLSLITKGFASFTKGIALATKGILSWKRGGGEPPRPKTVKRSEENPFLRFYKVKGKKLYSISYIYDIVGKKTILVSLFYKTIGKKQFKFNLNKPIKGYKSFSISLKYKLEGIKNIPFKLVTVISSALTISKIKDIKLKLNISGKRDRDKIITVLGILDI